ncbi:cytochrome b-c1 complex subunit 7-like [Argopecten irradians]|uniref:cytochrome b-c1 complex subunit 7-like n=1 Tax=Argopecten irradians TaxID=31199 RepID=UPI003720C9F7
MSAKSVVTRISSEVVKTSWADSIATAVFSNPLAQMFNKKVYRKLIYYPQMGLYRDDCTKRNIYAPGVLEAAVQRLPESVQRERQFRISRAFLHSTGKTILDRKEWTMDDVSYINF